MRVLGYTWAGMRAGDLQSAERFFADIMGFSLIHESKGLVQFEMPSGQLFEVFGSESRYYQLHACPVLAFQVEDVRAARKELESRGVEFVTDVEGNESEAWAYFRGPDGYLYELWQTTRPWKGLPPNQEPNQPSREISVEARKRLVHRNPKSAI
jgi:catechol 2,3-dioxygenase-like lactoylglutathione lyase family enzyme